MKIRDLLKAIEDMERPARAVLFIAAAGIVVLVVGAALAWSGARLYEWASAQLQALRVAQTVEFWAVRTKPVRTEVVSQTNPRIDAGPFDSRSVCEAYAALMTRYSHYAVIARQHKVSTPSLLWLPGNSSWSLEVEGGEEIVEICQALRGVRGIYSWPLGTSLEEAQKPLRELLANMKKCYDEWGRPGGGRYVLVEQRVGGWILTPPPNEPETFGELPDPTLVPGSIFLDRQTGKKFRIEEEYIPGMGPLLHCTRPPKDWANLPTD